MTREKVKREPPQLLPVERRLEVPNQALESLMSLGPGSYFHHQGHQMKVFDQPTGEYVTPFSHPGKPGLGLWFDIHRQDQVSELFRSKSAIRGALVLWGQVVFMEFLYHPAECKYLLFKGKPPEKLKSLQPAECSKQLHAVAKLMYEHLWEERIFWIKAIVPVAITELKL